MSWRELPIGDMILELGNSIAGRTGEWRVFRPVIDQDACTRCLVCWMYCPDGVIRVVDTPYRTSKGRLWSFTLEIDYEHCKGCGLCAEECPVNAIAMVEEVK